MHIGTHRFHIGSLECFALSDGAFNYPLGSLFASVPVNEVQAALQNRHLKTDRVTTPTSVFSSTPAATAS